MYYLNCFFIYSFIGFIYENIIELVRGKKPPSACAGTTASPATIAADIAATRYFL